MITFAVLLLIPALLMLAIYAIISIRETVRQVRTRPARGFWAERQERKGRANFRDPRMARLLKELHDIDEGEA